MYSDPLARRLIKAAYLAGFAAGLDGTSAFFIFPSVRDELANGDTASATWLLTIVGIVSAAVLLQAGRLADRFGQNRVLVAGAAGAAGAALLAAAAPTLELLVVAKGLQSGFMAAVLVSSLAIIVREAPPHRLATALGTWAFWTATSGVCGPLLASGLIELGSWRLMFVASAPIAAAVGLLAWPGWRAEFVRSERAPVDYIGTVAAMGGLSLAVFALLEGNDWGWSSGRTLGCLAVATGLLWLVVARSRVQADPIVPLHVFHNRNFSLSVVIGFVSSMAFHGMWLALLSYATDVWGQALLTTGFVLALMPGTMTFFARAAGRFADTNGLRGVMAVGSLVFSLGFATFALTAGDTTNNALLLPAVVAGGIGMATVISNGTAAGTATLETSLVGTGTAILQTFHRVGGSLGSAVVVAVLETGTIGEAATHRRSIWVIAGLGVAVIALSLALSPNRRPALSATPTPATS